jgi:hypothetical protein
MAFALCLVPASCNAQGIPNAFFDGPNNRPGEGPGARLSFGLPSKIKGHAGELAWTRASANIGYPVVQNESTTVVLTGGYGYTRIDSPIDRPFPRRLVSSSLGVISKISISDLSLSIITTGALKSDADKVEPDSFQFFFGVNLKIPIDETLSISPGVILSSSVSQELSNVSLRYVPLPSVTVNWKPTDTLSVSINPVRLSLNWTKLDWFQVFARYSLPLGPGVRFTHDLSSRLSISESFGHFSEVYHLSDSHVSDNTMITLSTYGAGFDVAYRVPIGSAATGPSLLFKVGYVVGFEGKFRLQDYRNQAELAQVRTNVVHGAFLSISLNFSGAK